MEAPVAPEVEQSTVLAAMVVPGASPVMVVAVVLALPGVMAVTAQTVATAAVAARAALPVPQERTATAVPAAVLEQQVMVVTVELVRTPRRTVETVGMAATPERRAPAL